MEAIYQAVVKGIAEYEADDGINEYVFDLLYDIAVWAERISVLQNDLYDRINPQVQLPRNKHKRKKC